MTQKREGFIKRLLHKWQQRGALTPEERMPRLRRNIRLMLMVFVCAFVALLGYFTYSVTINGARWSENPYNTRLNNEKQRIVAGSILDRNGKVLAETPAGQKGERTYPLGHHAAHVVGYDHDKFGRAGAEAVFYRKLLGMDRSLLERVLQALRLPEEKGDDVVLTLDADIQTAASKAFDNAGLQGACVLLDARTGETLAMVAKPDFNPSKLDTLWEAEQKEPSGEGILVNRATQGLYPPGSAFKLITASAVLRYMPAAAEEIYTCTGEIEIDGHMIYCYHNAAHGTIGMNEALAVSCNVYFAHMAERLGGAHIQAEAERWGFNNDFLFSDIRVGVSSYTQPKEINALAWSAIGQDKDLVTPIHMAMIAGAIANNGDMMEPKLVYEVRTATQRPTLTLRSKVFTHVDANITQLQEAMELTVKSGTAGRLRTSKLKNLTMGGKTGTAEKVTSKGKVNESWFVGYCDTGERLLAIAVVVEDTTKAASSVAVPIAAKVFEAALGK